MKRKKRSKEKREESEKKRQHAGRRREKIKKNRGLKCGMRKNVTEAKTARKREFEQGEGRTELEYPESAYQGSRLKK